MINDILETNASRYMKANFKDVIDFGPVRHDVVSFEVDEDDDEKKRLVVYSTGMPKAINNVNAGEVVRNDKSLILKKIDNSPMTFFGLFHCSNQIIFDDKTGQRFNKDVYNYDYFETGNDEDCWGDDYKVIESVYGIDSNVFEIWPHLSNYNKETKTEIFIAHKDSKLQFNDSSLSSGTNFNSVMFNIGSVNISLTILDKKLGKGFIFYSSKISREERDKIRLCISYALGRKLSLQSFVVLNSKFKRVAFWESSREYNGKFKPLSTKSPIQLENQFNKLINALYSNFNRYDLQHVLWNYLNALEAHVDKMAVYYGAAIEAFQKVYLEINKTKISSALIDKGKWRLLNKKISPLIDELELPDDISAILRNKLNSLNQAPQKEVTKRFFDNLNLGMSPLEEKAWQQRNNAAHGNKIDDDGIIELIRENKVLMCLFNRVLLSAINGSENYIDYYTYNYPVRALNDSIPSD